MAKKTMLIFLLLWAMMINTGFADLSDQLNQALEYKKASNFSQAEAIYQDIITNHSSTDYAVKAKIGLARMHKRTGRYSEAEALYNGVLASNAGLNDMMETQKHLAILYIATDRDQEAQAAVNKLKTDFSNHSRLPFALSGIARSYERYNRNEDAKDVYRTIKTNHPDSDFAFIAHNKLVSLGAETESNPAAQAIAEGLENKLPYNGAELPDVNETLGDINTLISNYSGYPYLPGVISRAAGSYYVKALRLKRNGQNNEAHEYYQKAGSIYDILVNEFPNSIDQQAMHTYYKLGENYRQLGMDQESINNYQKLADNYQGHPDVGYAYYNLGDWYHKLGMYQEAIDNYQMFVDNYPQHPDVWHVLAMIGRNYEKMEKAGLVSTSQAKSNIKSAYEQLVTNYPNCKAAKMASNWLKKNNSK